MPSLDAALHIDTVAQDSVPVRVRASGDWTFNGLKARHEELSRGLADLGRQPADRVAWDLTEVGTLDDAGAVWLAHAMHGARHVTVSDRHREILRQVSQGLLVPREGRNRFDPLWAVAAAGRSAMEGGVHLRDGIALLEIGRAHV